MYETQTYDAILTRMLARVPDTIDKREGSVIYDACAPAAAELAQMYIELDVNYNLSFVDTASGEYLGRKTSEFGVNRSPATASERRGLFYGANNTPLDVPIGGRYAIEGLTYVVKERVITGDYKLLCESVGVAGNTLFGTLLPIDHVPNLTRAVLSNVLIPGEDEETDESLRNRFYEAVNEPPFGGNIADYKQKINSMPGIGASKVYPVWNGGGTVKCTIIASDWSVPSSTLVSEVQTNIDPIVNSGKGIGLAPIGHEVTITGVVAQSINVESSITLANGYTIGMVQAEIESVIGQYLLEQRQSWDAQTQIIVRGAQIDARILTVPGVEDVNGTTVNGSSNNVMLDSDDIPLLGTVLLHG